MRDLVAPVPLAAVATAAALLGAVALLLWRRRAALAPAPARWRPAGRLSGISVYPLKSGAGVNCQRARVTSLGLRTEAGVLDRSLAVVCDGQVLFASSRRKLVLIAADVTEAQVTLTAPGRPPLTLQLPLPASHHHVNITNVMLAGHPDSGVDLGPDAGEWLDTFFADEKRYSLIYFVPEILTPRRTIDLPRPYAFMGEPKDIMTYNFSTPVSLLVTASLDELNSRLETSLTKETFRHNLIVDKARAFSEDSWLQIKIGTTVLRKIKPVHRCAVTLVDPKTAEISPKMEPMKTLRKFRMAKTEEDKRIFKDSPLFGTNLGVDVEGDVSVGDVVYVMS